MDQSKFENKPNHPIAEIRDTTPSRTLLRHFVGTSPFELTRHDSMKFMRMWHTALFNGFNGKMMICGGTNSQNEFYKNLPPIFTQSDGSELIWFGPKGFRVKIVGSKWRSEFKNYQTHLKMDPRYGWCDNGSQTSLVLCRLSKMPNFQNSVFWLILSVIWYLTE